MAPGLHESVGLIVEIIGWLRKTSVALMAKGLSTKTGARQVASADHTVQVEDDLLRTTHGKGGDDDLAAACHGVLDDIPQFHKSLFRVAVRFIAISTFHYEIVSTFGNW